MHTSDITLKDLGYNWATIPHKASVLKLFFQCTLRSLMLTRETQIMKNVPHVSTAQDLLREGALAWPGESEQGPLVPFLSEARSDLAHLSPSHTLLCTKQALILVEL